MSGVDVVVLNDLLRAATFYCDREGVENRSKYASDMLVRGEECIAAVADLIEGAKRAQHILALHDDRCPRLDAALANVRPQS
jgi:hypothetical protein